MHKVKCFIVHFNRPATLLRQLEVLGKNDQLELCVIDNCSDPPLVEVVKAHARSVNAGYILMDMNYRHSVVWGCNLSRTLAPNENYIVTDCDVIPPAGVDYVELLGTGLSRHPEVMKCGLELNVSRIPPDYPRRAAVLVHEKQFLYRKPCDEDFQYCAIDTTFAMYRAGYHHYSVWGTDSNQWQGKCLSLRTVRPEHEADHLGWHLVPPYDAETVHYFNSIRHLPVGDWKE